MAATYSSSPVRLPFRLPNADTLNRRTGSSTLGADRPTTLMGGLSRGFVVKRKKNDVTPVTGY
jgi:hypothetical protein